MKAKPITQLSPAYYEQFACIGSDCEDTCCAGWTVPIDVKTYHKYKNVEDEELSLLMDSYVIKKEPSESSQLQYATVKLDSCGSCPFLNEDKLCKIQLKIGEDYLSHTCHTYPRVTNQFDFVMERSLSVSCPEAARLAILNKNGIDFNQEMVEEDKRNQPTLQVETKGFKDHRRHLWEMRVLAIQTLQDRRYSIEDRLIMLGVFLQNIVAQADQHGHKIVPGFIEQCKGILDRGDLKDALGEVDKNCEFQIRLVLPLIVERIKYGVSSVRYAQCVEDCFNGIGYNGSNEAMELEQRYVQAKSQYYDSFIPEHEYVLENYLVNYMFRTMFPLNHHEDVMDVYLKMVVHFMLVKLHMVGMSAHYKQFFSEEHLVKLIQSFAKSYEHNTQIFKVITNALKNNDILDISVLSVIIKN
ncbi:flagellin lysine-N-methylase [Marinicrinis sediminis]|uniref:Flagellin lysine-N-methylase n=1 Tax=Marinicrinis sediminis TaxID=1652465 RepID=A0ABW5RAB9_9BACL